MELLTIKEVAEILKVRPATVKRLIKSGLPAHRVGRSWRVERTALEEWTLRPRNNNKAEVIE
jgi:excisionase family DNA binding protein